MVSDDQKGCSYPVTEPRVRIGRGPSNDVQTSSLHASRVHAEISRSGTDGVYILRDLGSANHTFLNGVLVTEAILRDGDLIEVGELRLIFRHGEAAQGAHPATRDEAERSAEDVVDLRSRTTTIVGRDPSSDLVLDHPQVSRKHARLELRPGGALLVTDLNSTNGTFVDGQLLERTIEVGAGATLTIGPYRLRHEDGRLIRGSEDGAIRIDCLRLSKRLPNGTALLHNVTLSILPREFVALVGGSGTGKSTLLDALSGVRSANDGDLRYNGVDYYQQMDSYRSAIGYVPQDDIVPLDLPVERALYYAAKLRLPEDMSEPEVHARVDEVLTDLDLTARRNIPVKHLSGGQRKRVSIGAELLAKPTVFFLDEPTSGLDPGLDARMMDLLHGLAEQGRTVVLVTHATQNIDRCHKIAFLAPGGHLAYYGPPGEALAYFGVEKFADIYTQVEHKPAAGTWSAHFLASPLWQRHVGSHLAAAGGYGAASSSPAQAALWQDYSPAAQRVSSMRQFAILTQRYLESIWRDHRNLTLLLAQAPIIAAMIALVFRGQIFDTTSGAGTGDNGQARKLLFLLAMVAVWFGTSNAAREIVKEAAIYARERRVNLKLGPYIASKVTVLTALGCLQTLILLAPLALVGATLRQLPLLYLGLVLGLVGGVGMGLAISAQAPNPDRAGSLVPIALIPQIIFTGVVVDLGHNAVGQALSNLMVTKWTYRALGAAADVDLIPVKLPAETLGSYQDEFSKSPPEYFAVLLLFIVVASGLILILLRRKDRAR